MYDSENERMSVSTYASQMSVILLPISPPRLFRYGIGSVSSSAVLCIDNYLSIKLAAGNVFRRLRYIGNIQQGHSTKREVKLIKKSVFLCGS